MTSRRGASHVRPRPPSSGRPTPGRQGPGAGPPARPAAPRAGRAAAARAARHPDAARALGRRSSAGAAFVLASGGIGPILSTLGAAFDSAIGRLTATPVPTNSTLPPTDSPRIASPQQPVHERGAGRPDRHGPGRGRRRSVREGPDLPGPRGPRAGARRATWAVGSTSRMVVPFELEKGRNDISATLVRSATDESEHSPIVTWILDLNPPKINIASPKDGAAVETPEAPDPGHDPGGDDARRSQCRERRVDLDRRRAATAHSSSSCRSPRATTRSRSPAPTLPATRTRRS